MKARTIVTMFFLLMASFEAAASQLAIRVGPPSVGNGGPNPLSLMPIDWQISYLTERNLDINISLTGLFVGKRYTFPWGGYVAGGVGLPISALGGSLSGVYSSFGGDWFCGWFCLSAEYIQAVGYVEGTFISPYAIRMGVSKWL